VSKAPWGYLFRAPALAARTTPAATAFDGLGFEGGGGARFGWLNDLIGRQRVAAMGHLKGWKTKSFSARTYFAMSE
jgi:hypothetical protein